MILIIFSYLKQTSTFHARMAWRGKAYNANKLVIGKLNNNKN
jgi:hypothetical protein